MKDTMKHRLKVILAILVVGIVWELLIFAVLNLCLDRYLNSLSLFPVSDGYRWECQEIDMYFYCHRLPGSEIKVIDGEAVIDGTVYELAILFYDYTRTWGRIECRFCDDSGILVECLQFRYKIKGDTMTCTVIEDDYGITPENRKLTFVKVPIDPAD